jgi:hypothetical protein
MDAQQELFTAFKLALEEKGYAVYDGALPPENTPYPFIYFGEFRQTDTELKNAVTGVVYPMIHVWHNNWNQRGTVSKMLLDIKTICRTLEHTTNFAWIMRNINSRTLADNTTKTPLLHGVFEADCVFS